MPDPFPVTPRSFAGERAGRRQLAIRIIGETGARAAHRPFADELHPPTKRTARWTLLDRVPRDIARRGLGRLNRLVVNRIGGLLLRWRGGGPEAVQLVHQLDHRCFELEQRIEELEGQLAAARAAGRND